jgi:hypothetical protein
VWIVSPFDGLRVRSMDRLALRRVQGEAWIVSPFDGFRVRRVVGFQIKKAPSPVPFLNAIEK